MAVNVQRLWAIISALEKPLEFASRNGFARVGSLKGLCALAAPLIDEALAMEPAGGLGHGLCALKNILRDFDGLGSEEKKSAIKKSLELMGASIRPAITKEAALNIKKLQLPLLEVKGIGPRLSGRLGKKGLATVFDLLYFLPVRYEDRRTIMKISELSVGASSQVRATVAAAGETRYGRRRVFEVVVDDGSAILHLKWFHYKSVYMKRFSPGKKLLIHGAVTRFGRAFQMIHPDVEALGEDDERESRYDGITAVYPEIDGIHQKTFRKIIGAVIKKYAPMAPGVLPPDALRRLGVRDLPSALMSAHFPRSMPDDTAGAGKRAAMRDLAFDELFLLETALLLKRGELKKKKGLQSYHGSGKRDGLEKKLRAILPFCLTGAQERVIAEIKKDMSGATSMNRLLEGDVGCGKTIVSLISALLAVDSGLQSAIMAPTSILAEQHYETIKKYAAPLGVRYCLLTGGLAPRERKKRLEEIREGGVDIVVGTHALIQKDVKFKALGLVVVDEQHRFGVLQRAELKRKGLLAAEGGGCDGRGTIPPDMLIMTATPIPRTLSMTVFGDLEVSVIDELPPGRRPVKTRIYRENGRRSCYELIRDELKAGAQAYIVYPLVEESDELDLRDATQEKIRLERDVFPDFNVALIHGRMKSEEKEAVMRDFKTGNIHILVSTTVIEVGLDVPCATVMCVEHAERFGLAQLHQLRGRVGRGQRASYCLLMTDHYLAEESYRRLKVMEATTDGFRIAEEDLKIRGPGDYLGRRQSGLADFRFAWALVDSGLVKAAREEATALIVKNPELKTGPGPWIREALMARWSQRLELAGVG